MNKPNTKTPPNPDQISHYEHKLSYEIDAWDLHIAMKNGDDVVVIDTRSSESYQKEHIPTAINFPHRSMNETSAAEILNFNTLYVTYCDGIGCNASTKGALNLAKLGYRVKELIGGIDWWKKDGYEVAHQAQPQITQSTYNCGCEG